MSDHPRSVLFACNRNTIRSPMAEALMKHLLGYRINVDSVGVRLSASEVDPFAIAALAEIGLDISQHRPKTFDHLHDRTVDLIVTFTPQAQHRAVELTREVDCDIEYWPLSDPTLIEGNRETRLARLPRPARGAVRTDHRAFPARSARTITGRYGFSHPCLSRPPHPIPPPPMGANGGAVGRTVVQKHDASRTADSFSSAGLRHATGVTVQPQPLKRGGGLGRGGAVK